MSGDEPILDAPTWALVEIANGIDLAHAELKDLGMIGEASVGRGFSDLALSGLELGHSGLAAEFETFCNRWEWGVRALTLKGNVFAQGVGLSAGSYAEQERYVKDSIKVGVNALNGNPHLSEDEVKQMSWETIWDQRAWDNADWSGESFSQAHEDVKQTWKNTPRVGQRRLERGIVLPGARRRQADLEEHRLRRHGRATGLHGALRTDRPGGA